MDMSVCTTCLSYRDPETRSDQREGPYVARKLESLAGTMTVVWTHFRMSLSLILLVCGMYGTSAGMSSFSVVCV